MALEDTGPLYGRIGQILVDSLGPLHHRLLLYVHYEVGAVTVMIVEDRGDHLYFHSLPDADAADLNHAVQTLWEAEPGPEHWVEMRYLVENGKFNAKLFYADNLDPSEVFYRRMDRVPEELFGQKPARCAPFPQDSADGYTFKY